MRSHGDLQLMDEDGGNNNKRMAEESPTTWHSYMAAKKAKLRGQFEEDIENLEKNGDGSKSDLFAGLTIHTNGCANPSNEQLRELIARYGGKHDFYYSRKTTTHVVAEALAFTKMKTFANCIVVKPAWILDSIAAGKLLPCDKYSVLHSAHQPYQRGEAQISEEETCRDEANSSASETDDELLGDERNVSEPQASDSPALKAGDPGFLEAFFRKSRLHHLSAAGNEFKSYVQEKRSEKAATFVGLQRLKRFVKEMNLSSSSIRPEPRIMHIDMDCFFVSVGLLDKPLLREQPVVVAHAKTGRGESRPGQSDGQFNSFSELASCNYEARKFGVRNGMLLKQALKLCPHLNIIPYNFEEYARVSQVLYDLILSFTLEVEAVSCDEMFVDIQKLVEDAKCDPTVFASFIRQEMRRLTRCNASVGIGPNVLIAKLASKAAKPNDHLIISTENVLEFMAKQKLEGLPGIGSSLASKLAEKFSAESCGNMFHVPSERLREVFGKTLGEKIYSMCRGIDRSELKFDQASARKSVSVEVNYGIRFTEWAAVERFLFEVAQETTNRLQKIKAKGKCVTLKIKVRREDAPVQTAKYMGHGICDNISRSTLLSFPTDSPQLIGKSVVNIMQSMSVPVADLRGIAIQITKLVIGAQVDSSLPENSNSIQRFFLANPAPTPSSASIDHNQTESVTKIRTPPPSSLDEVDPDFLNQLPEDLRLEITESFRNSQPNVRPSEVGAKKKTTVVKKGKRSPKKKPAAASKLVAGPLDRMFSNLTSANLERQVLSVMSRPSTLCGCTEMEGIKDILEEWIASEERLEDEDVAYVTKFMLDLVTGNKWTMLRTSLLVMQEQFSKRNDAEWSQVYNMIVSMIRNDVVDSDAGRDIRGPLFLDIHLLEAESHLT